MNERHVAEFKVSNMLNATAKVEAIKHCKLALAYNLVDKFIKTTTAKSLLLFRPQAAVRLHDFNAAMYADKERLERAYDVYQITGYMYGEQVIEDAPLRIVSVEEIDALCNEFYLRTRCNATHIFLPPHCRIVAYDDILRRQLREPINGIYNFKIVENAQTLAVGIL